MFGVKTTIFCIILCCSHFSEMLAQDKMKGPFSTHIKFPIELKINNDSAWSYKFYKKFISPVSPNRCSMYPSCSTYAAQAFSRFGFFRGFIMMADRLTRCGNDLHRYPRFILNGREYAIDPVKKK